MGSNRLLFWNLHRGDLASRRQDGCILGPNIPFFSLLNKFCEFSHGVGCHCLLSRSVFITITSQCLNLQYRRPWCWFLNFLWEWKILQVAKSSLYLSGTSHAWFLFCLLYICLLSGWWVAAGGSIVLGPAHINWGKFTVMFPEILWASC